MRTFRPPTVLVLLLLVVFALPALCVGMPAASTCTGAGETPAGSHGDHCPASQPPRDCCQVDHGTPMTVPTAPLTLQPVFVSAVISDADDGPIGAVAHFVTRGEFSPPAVLRI